MQHKQYLIVTNPTRSTFRIGNDNDIDNAIDIDSGVVTPCMGLPRKYWYVDCIILVIS
jgi:hypothetical protein